MLFRSPDQRITRSPDSSCYTSPFPLMLKAAAPRYAILLAALLLTVQCLAQQEAASPWQAPADDLVQQVLSRAGSPGAINLTFANLSSLSSADQSAIKQVVMTAFRNVGVRLVKADFALAEVEITFSEDWQNYVWVAEIKQGPGSQLVIRKVPRPQKPAALHTPNLTIKRSLIW